jgi:hypothetical protein
VSFQLADLYVSDARHADAATLYQKLLVDELALPTRELDLNEIRERAACGLARSYLALGNASGLEQAFIDAKRVLAADDRIASARIASRPSAKTLEVFVRARQSVCLQTSRIQGRGSIQQPSCGCGRLTAWHEIRVFSRPFDGDRCYSKL